MAVRINLLDWRTERTNMRRQQFGAMVIAGAVAGAAIIGSIYYMYTGWIEYQQARNQFLKQQIAEMEKKIKEIQELEKVKQNLLARMKVIEELQASRSAMVHFFDEVVNTLPEGVYLQSLKQTGTRVTISGVAESNNRVSTYMKNIESSGWFADPTLQIINTRNAGKRREAEFKLTFQNLTRKKVAGESGVEGDQ